MGTDFIKNYLIDLFLISLISIPYFSKAGDAGIFEIEYAAVVELADTRDLKSLGSNIVPVQVWSAAPIWNLSKPSIYVGLETFCFLVFR